MSQPSNIATGSDAPTRDDEQPEQINFTLVVVSPSVGVPGPLSFTNLPATTSVKELKAKIRDALPSKPADESQRLIHRGRMLARETETMLEIFGKVHLAKPESQTLHLVLRPPSGDPSSVNPTAPPIVPQRATTPLSVLLQARPQSTPNVPNHGMQTQLPLPGFQQVNQHQLLHQTDHLQNMMAQRLQQLQQETVRLQNDMMNIEQRTRALAAGVPGLFPPQQAVAGQTPPITGLPNQFPMPNGHFRPTQPMPPSVQNLLNQQQRERAAEGRHGAQDQAPIPHFTGVPQPGSGRASPNVFRPDHSTTHTREGVGPNGERWQITVNETTTTFPLPQGVPHAQPQPHLHHHHHQHPVQHANNPVIDNVQTILRHADRFQHRAPVRNNPFPTAGADQPALVSTIAPGSVAQTQIPPRPLGAPTTAQSSTTSSAVANLPPTISSSNAAVQARHTVDAIDPMVYILSSPQGPRAVLLNNADTFYTPRTSMRRRRETPGTGQAIAGGAAASAGGEPAIPDLVQNRNPDGERIQQDRIGNAHPPQPVIGQAHANPGAGALAARIGPLIWLFVRLAGFVWFFTSGNSSWFRFFMVSAFAFGIFIVNTGLLNGTFEQLWGPIRRHVEALIPLAGPDAALVPAINARAPQQPEEAAGGAVAPVENRRERRRRPGELDEAEVAARLIEQHRQANTGWLMTQFRRAEHSALLFVASLVPGVGERHIAAREAEAAAAEAERQRQIEAEAAAAAEAEAEAEATGLEATNAEETNPNEANEQTQENGDTERGEESRPDNVEGEAPPPLIEV